MFISRSINITPDQSIFTLISKDRSLGTLTSVPSNPSITKRFASCRAAYSSLKSQQSKLKHSLNLKSNPKGSMDYLQDCINKPKIQETTEYPAEYYTEIQDCLNLIGDFERDKDKIIEKFKAFKEFDWISDVILSGESFGRFIGKSEWFALGGRRHCLKDFLYFFKLFIERICKVFETLASLKKANSDLLQANTLQKINTENNELKLRIKALSKNPSSSTEKLKAEIKAMRQKEKNWFIEKTRINEEVFNVKSQIAQTKQVIETPEINEGLVELQIKSELIEKLKKKIESLKYQIIKNQFDTGNLKDKLIEKEKEIEDLKNSLTSIQEVSEKRLKINDSVYQENFNLAQRLGMVIEDLAECKAVLEKQRIQTAEIKSSLEKNDAQNSQYYEEETIHISLDDPLFKLNTTSGDYSNVTYNHFNYQFVRPTFKEMLNPQPSAKAYYTPPFKNWVFFLIRGIYDSKFYEHSLNYTSPNSSPTRFVDFVYSWISNYTVDENSRNVVEMEWWKRSKADEIRYQFLLSLAPEISKRSWELTTFKEFLNESRTMDELAFFLHCRFVLIQSPQLQTTFGKYSKIHMLNLDYVLKVLGKLFHKASFSDFETIKQVLIEKAKKTRLIPMIDLAVVLRVALEYFKQEKFLKYSLIRSLFELVQRENPGVISFYHFHHICKNLSLDLNELDVVKFYRDCWTFSCGKIDPDVFYVIGNENSVFVKILKLPGLRALEEITVLNNARVWSQPVRRIFEVVEKFKSGDKELDMLKFGVDNMGVLELSDKFSKISGLMTNYLNLPNEELWIWKIEDLYQRFWGIIVTCSLGFIECNSSDIKLLAYRLRKEQNNELDTDNIRKATTRFVDILFAMNLNKIKSNIAARKIQKFWKMKAERNIGLVSTVMKSVRKFKALRKGDRELGK